MAHRHRSLGERSFGLRAIAVTSGWTLGMRQGLQLQRLRNFGAWQHSLLRALQQLQQWYLLALKVCDIGLSQRLADGPCWWCEPHSWQCLKLKTLG